MDEVLDLLAAQSDRQTNPAAVQALQVWSSLIDGLPRQGTMKAWFHSHDGDTVRTLQIDVRRDGALWAPGPRVVSAGASFVNFDGSRRDYAGMRVLGADEQTLVVSDDWHSIIYTTATESAS